MDGWTDGWSDELICEWINISVKNPPWTLWMVLAALCCQENVISKWNQNPSATELRAEQSLTSIQRTTPSTQRTCREVNLKRDKCSWLSLTEPELEDKNEITMSRYPTKSEQSQENINETAIAHSSTTGVWYQPKTWRRCSCEEGWHGLILKNTKPQPEHGPFNQLLSSVPTINPTGIQLRSLRRSCLQITWLYTKIHKYE